VPGPNQSVELQDLLLHPSQLSPECQETRASYLWNSPVVRIGDDSKQFLDTLTPDRRNDPELGKMSPDRIDHRGTLTDEQMARVFDKSEHPVRAVSAAFARVFLREPTELDQFGPNRSSATRSIDNTPGRGVRRFSREIYGKPWRALYRTTLFGSWSPSGRTVGLHIGISRTV
jgi:hypothetical protein